MIDGLTPIDDVKHALEIDEFPDWDHYETLAGFIMYRLRKIPRPADWVEHAGYKFEVVDIDHYKIDQLLVTRLPTLSSEEINQNLDKAVHFNKFLIFLRLSCTSDSVYPRWWQTN